MEVSDAVDVNSSKKMRNGCMDYAYDGPNKQKTAKSKKMKSKQ